MHPKLIIIEGIPGAGKTTTARFVKGWLQRSGLAPRLYLEGDLDHPADYESVACLPSAAYASLQERYPAQAARLDAMARILEGDVLLPYRKLEAQGASQELVAELAQHEIYELPAAEYCRVAARGWREFAARAGGEPDPYIFECCFLQNPLTTLLARHNWPAWQAGEYVRQVAESFLSLNALILYLDPADLRATLEQAAQARPKEWLEYVTWYVTGQAWGREQSAAGFEGLLRFYQYRREVEVDLLARLPLACLRLAHARQDWPSTLRQVERFLEEKFSTATPPF